MGEKVMLRTGAILGILMLSVSFVGCGKGQTPPPPPPPTTLPGTLGGGLGGTLDAPSPGTPWGQLSPASQEQSFSRMAQTLVGLGVATIQNQSAVDYIMQSNSLVRLPGQAAPPQTGILTYYYQGNQFNYGGISISLSAQHFGSRQFLFASEINLGGVRLYSTDQIALFESSENSYDILKVDYRNPNATMEWYSLEVVNQYGYQSHLHVIQRSLAPRIQPYYSGQSPGWR